MSSRPSPVSLVAERAVRYLRDQGGPVDSRDMARAVLATSTPDEATARRVLQAAFGEDKRLRYAGGAWNLAAGAEPHGAGRPAPAERGDTETDPPRALLFLEGRPAGRGEPFRLASVSVLRVEGDEITGACGGDTADGPYGRRLRRTVLETLDGAVPVVHEPAGSIRSLERWLGEPVEAPISLRRLGRERVGLPANHDFETLVGRLGLPWRATDDPLEMADMLDACLQALRRPGEDLEQMRGLTGRAGKPIDWSSLAFGRSFLRRIPHLPGTYRFFDQDGNLLYVGKSNDLNRRIGSYFRETGPPRTRRVQRLLDSLYRIEYEATGSDLEAVLREAEQIRRDRPDANVQRTVRPRRGRAARLRSILILEPAAPPAVLRAFLIRDGRLVDRVAIGPRGGGLRRIRRVLEDRFFGGPDGPTAPAGPDLDVELVVRWLAENRDRTVAFDPTDLQNADDVIERLRWFLDQGHPFDHDGGPVHTR